MARYRSTRQKDKLRKRQQRQQELNLFTHHPIDNDWRRDHVEALDIPAPHQYPAFNYTTTNVPLSNPTIFRMIIGDGNCFFRCLSYFITGREEHHHQIRQTICDFMKSNQENVQFLLPQESNGNVIDYLSMSNMEEDGTWATEIEILAASMLLQTNIYIYTKNGVHWSWIRHTSQFTTTDRGIYLYHKNGNHFDIVVGIENSQPENIPVGEKFYFSLEENKKKEHALKSLKNSQRRQKYTIDEEYKKDIKERCRRRYQCDSKSPKQQYRSNPKYREEKQNYLKQYQKKKYETDTTFRLKKQQASKRCQRQLYTRNTSYREKKLKAFRKYYWTKQHVRLQRKCTNAVKYCSNAQFRSRLTLYGKRRYTLDINYKNYKKQCSVNRYKSDEIFHKKVKGYSTKKYSEDQLHRENVKTYSKKKYSEDCEHRENVKTYSKKKYSEDCEHRENVKTYSKKKYSEDPLHKQKVKQYSTTKYAENSSHRENVKSYSKKKYSQFSAFRNFVKASSVKKYSSSPLFRSKLKRYLRNQYHCNAVQKKLKKDRVKISRQSVTKAINKFKKDIQNAPNYICTVCIRILYKSQVRMCKRQTYFKDGVLNKMAEECLTGSFIHSCEENGCLKNCVLKRAGRDKEWICFTCDRYLKQQSMPPQSQKNNLYLPDIPEVLSKLNILERQLIALRIAFMKMLSLPKGGQKGVKGPIVNVPSDISTVTTSLPRNIEDSQLIKVKLKRKLDYKGHYTYQWIDPKNVLEALQDLLQRNIWYQNINMNTSWISNINDSDLVQQISKVTEEVEDEKITNSDEEMEPDIKDLSSMTATEKDEVDNIPVDTCFQPIDIGQEVLDNNTTLCIAPAEKQTPQNIFQEEGSDAMAFPVLLPDGHFGLFEERKIKLSPAKYFNARLFSADRRFALDKEYIFFSQYVTELNYITSNISLALRKGSTTTDNGQKVTAKMLINSENVKEILKSDIGYRFLQPVRGTPPYWQRTMKDLYAMIRQLGIPTWFVTFSSAEMRWEEVTETLLYMNNDNRPVAEIEWAERAKMVADNPVTCARMFDHRVKLLFSNLIMSPSCPVGKVIDYFYRTEFQQRGSPHIHCLFWVKDSPKFNENSDEEVCQFIDQYISCKLPDKDCDPELFDIISTVQLHSKNHSKSCRKYSSACRFNFPKPPVQKTFIARTDTDTPLQNHDKSNVPTAEDLDDMSKLSGKTSKNILRDIWLLITSADQTNFSFQQILKLADVSYMQYKQCLKDIATRNTVHLQRSLHDVWVNNYNSDLSRAWNANLDIQFVTDSYACVAYILSYISKAETEMGDLLQNAKQEADEGNIEAAAAMRKIGNIYLQNREVSAQEAVYRVCSLHLKECTREVSFIPAGRNITKMSLPISIIKSKSNKSGEDEDIWMSSIHDKYYARPESTTFENMSLAEFSSKYRLISKSQKPKTNTSKSTLPLYELQKDLGFIQQRKHGKEAIIRFPRFNINKNPEEFYLTLIQLYVPHRSCITLPQQFTSFEEYVQTGVVNDIKVVSIIEKNRHHFERDTENLEKAWQDMQNGKISEDAWAFIAPETEAERLEIQMDTLPVVDDEIDEIPELISNDNNNLKSKSKTFEYQAPKFPEKIIQQALREMNHTQQELFYKIRNWCLQFLTTTKPDPFHVFLTGGAGTGKSHLIKCIYHEASRILSKCATSPDSTCVLLTAPTGTAAFNIQGLTIHSAFTITKKITLPYQPLSENILNTLRSKYDSLQLLIIDEVSMVDQKILTYIHGRLAQIKHSKQPFGNVSILAVGDFYQLPPVRGLPLHKSRDSDFADLWKTHFRIATLTEVMRQKQHSFAAMLNRIRVHQRGEPLRPADTEALTSRSFTNTPDNAMDYLHIFPTNKEVDKHNELMIKKKCSPVYTCLAQDFQRDIVTGKMSRRDQPYVTCAAEDLQTIVEIGVGARIMLTRNLDTDDGLVNGAFGTVTTMDVNNTPHVEAIYVKFDNPKIGLKHLKKRVTEKSKTGSVRIQLTEEILKGRQVTRKQFPVRLGWASTIHKVQGMTVANIVISLKKIFQPGMAYVALSRATSLAGLHILGFDADTIYSSTDITETLQEMPQFLSTTMTEETDVNNSITVIHHNTEGLLPHLQDIKHMKQLKACDIICFTETWLKPTAHIPTSLLPEHSSYIKSRKDSYTSNDALLSELKDKEKGGVAIFVKSEITNSQLLFKTQDLEAVACIIQDPIQMIICTVYRPPCYSQRLFTVALVKLLTEIQLLHIPAVILGDFNYNILKSTNSEILASFTNFGYSQHVNTPTTEAGSCLDLVFTKGLSEKTQVCVVPTYYSYHDLVKVIIPLEC